MGNFFLPMALNPQTELCEEQRVQQKFREHLSCAVGFPSGSVVKDPHAMQETRV